MSEPKKLSEGELIEISARLRKATRGDWMPSPPTSVLGSGVVSAPTGRVVAMGVASGEDAEFIATAHQDVEKLLAHINLMEAETKGREMELARQISISFMRVNDDLLSQIRHLSQLLGMCQVALEYEDHQIDISALIAEIKQTFGVA